MKSVRIAGAGICCLDHIVRSPSVPWGDTAEVSAYCVQGGGLAATALVTCARLGAQTELFSMLGEDEIGDQIVEGLRREGVSTSHVMRIPGGDSPFSFVHVDAVTGERTIFHRRAGGLRGPCAGHDAIARADAILVDDYYPDLAREAVAAARRHKTPIVADAIPGAANREWLSDVDVLIAPRHYLHEGGFGDSVDAALDAIHAIGPATAVITLGADGWAASDASGRSRGPAFRVQVVDTVGAGDVFHGAYAFALTQGWNAPQCAEFASAAAALKCTQPGGRTGIPDLATALGFLRDNSPNDWPPNVCCKTSIQA
ncbi:MAG TPA: PfkB family carbohydrate kinase [Candidatus Hydrogenedentes bacterium]|nr:PfkB family carbohydrate kinase [Candidatus Hydrogenedentota bacterium]HOS01837.1 PfkB family carbohydrate kinase [Candidatus Hydrogenedentota bacterium]